MSAEHAEMVPMLTVGEIAKVLGVSTPTVTRLFENEPGVITIDSPPKMHKRQYRTLRVPRHVYERVLRKLSTPTTLRRRT